MTKTRIIALAGGTASGKTTLACDLVRIGGAQRVQIVPLDAYYRCNAHLSPDQRARCNYDHPGAFEIDLLERHLCALLAGEAVQIPKYDFSTHSRSNVTQHMAPSKIILVEGILALHFAELRKLYAASVFVDTPDELRYSRRMSRDIRERGRTEDSVSIQWNDTVHPMHIEFCQPTKAYATEIFSGQAWNDEHVLALLERLARG